MNIALVGGIFLTGIQTINAGPNEELLKAVEAKNLDEAMSSAENATNIEKAIRLARYDGSVESEEIAGYLKEVIANRKDDELESEIDAEVYEEERRIENASPRSAKRGAFC